MEGHLEEEHFEKGKGLFEKGHLEKRQLRKGIVEGQFIKGIMEGQSGGALWKGRKGIVHKLEFLRILPLHAMSCQSLYKRGV